MRKIIFVLIALVSVAAVACSDGVEDLLTEEPRPTPEPLVTQAPASPPQAPAAAPSQSAPSPTAPANSSTSPASPSAAPQTQQAPASQPAPSVESSGGQVRGGIFRRLWADPPTLDPHLTTDTTSAGVVVEIFSGLVALNTDLQLVPDIAESWDISPDGTVYTFQLRPHAKFHDGKAITASDFKWSIERAASPDTASPVADTYLADIVGVNAVLEGDSTDISGIKVIDDHTLQIAVDAGVAQR